MNQPKAIKSISISGYKSAIDTRAELGALNVLIGPNGAGKSVLLESIELLGRAMTEDVPIPREHVSSKNRAVKISAHLSNGQILSAHKHPESDLLKAQSGQNVPDGLKHWETYRLSPPGLTPKDSGTGPKDSLRTDGANLPAFLQYLAENRERVHHNIFLRLGIYSAHHKGRGPKDITTLSEGSVRILTLCALLENAMAAKPTILIIEHPENMTSESFQTIIAGFMKSISIDTQVIATTHSGIIVDGMKPENLIIAEIPREGTPNARPGTSYRRLSADEIAGLDPWLEDHSLGEIWLKNIIGARP